MLYKLIHNVLPLDSCVYLSHTMVQTDGLRGDPQCPNSKAFCYVPWLDVLLPIIKPQIEEVWGKTLIPTYSYGRVMYPGCDLKEHTDRESCEYSVTVTLGHNYEGYEYPIFMGNTPVAIPIGSGVTYKGREIPHSRDPLPGTPNEFWVQAFFHYVDADGPYAHFRWDKESRVERYNEIEEELAKKWVDKT
jgi:hypothetical protein